MKSSNEKKSRKDFLSNLFKSGILAVIFLETPLNKLFGLTKNPKIYFRENPDSVKRQK